jgi:hypothetical protein
VVDDVWAETIAEWLCHDCIQKYGIHFDAEDQDLEDAHVVDHMDHEEHSQASGSVMTIEDDTAKTSNRRMEQAVSGIGISYAQVSHIRMHELVLFTYKYNRKRTI